MSKRRRFFLTYLATAVLSSVVVFFGAPLVRGSISTERFDSMVRACRSDAPISGILMAMVRLRSRPAQEPEYDRPAGPQPRIPRPRRADTPDQGRGGRIFLGQFPAIPDQTTAVNNNIPAPPVYDYACMWAIVTNDTAAVYDANGNLAQELAPGTLVEVAAVRTNQTERLAICRYSTKPKDMELALIRARDLQIRKGSLDSANADLLSLLMKQTQMETEIRALRSSFASELAKRNPHTEAFSRAHAACVAFNERAKTLRTAADRSQGADRVEAHDKLRSMKEEGVQLSKQYDSARRAFEKWNEQNAGGATESESVKALQQQLADVRKQIGRIDAH